MKAYIKTSIDGNIISVLIGEFIVAIESEYDFEFQLDNYIDPTELTESWKIENGQLIKEEQ